MRRVVAGLVLAVVLAGVVVVLKDQTQNRRDAHVGDASELVLQVRTKGGYDVDLAASGLWGFCQQTVDTLRLTSFEGEGEGRYRLRLEPAVGEHAQRRLVGCLEDGTLPRVQGSVESLVTL